MSGKATKAEIAALVMPVTAATALAPALAFAGHSCAIPISVAAAIFVTGGWYCWLAAAPPPDEVEETRRRLWLRYNPAQADAAGAAATLTAAIPAEARSAETEAALQSLTGAASNAAGEGDRAIVYVERVLDRQINKLRGVLSFDALLMAFLSVERGRVPPLRPVLDFATACLAPLTIVLVLLVVSSVLCLDVFRMHWSPPEKYDTFAIEHETTVELAAHRTLTVQRAARLAEVAVVGAILCFLLIELGTPLLASGRFAEGSPAPPPSAARVAAVPHPQGAASPSPAPPRPRPKATGKSASPSAQGLKPREIAPPEPSGRNAAAP